MPQKFWKKLSALFLVLKSSLCQNIMVLGVKMAEIFEKKTTRKSQLKKKHEKCLESVEI